jgi:hypothetical protein
MDRRISPEPAHPGIGMVAQLILYAAREDASLITRARDGTSAAPVHPHSQPALWAHPHLSLALESRAGRIVPQHLEDLVSITVSSVQQADVVQRARQISARARRGALAFTCIGTLLFVAAIDGIADHRLWYESGRERAVRPSDSLSIAEPQKQAGEQPTEIKVRAPAPIGPAGRLNGTGSSRASAVEASTRDSQVIGHASVTRLGERRGTTAEPAVSNNLHATNLVIGATTARTYPTRPSGFNPSTPPQSPVSNANIWPSSQHWPSHGSPLRLHKSSEPRRGVASVGSGPTGNPVRDFQRFTKAVGRAIGSIFR